MKHISPVYVVDLADKGKSIGKDNNGFVYLVDKAVPGDVVALNYKKKKKGMRYGFVEEFIELSKDRVSPQCEHFGVCGGCKWQHFKYESQLYFKKKAVMDAIKKIAEDSPQKVEDIIPCQQVYAYRNKLEYTFSNKRWLTREEIESEEKFDHRNALGFHPAGFYDKVVDIKVCHLQPDFSNYIKNFIRNFALKYKFDFYDYNEHRGFLRNLIVRNSSQKEWMVILVVAEDKPKLLSLLLSALTEKFPAITSLYYIINTKKNDSIFDLQPQLFCGKAYIEEKLGRIRFRVGPKSFFQTNTRQAKKLFDCVKSLLDLKGNEILYDLYSGIGSIALYLADSVKEVYAIEEIEAATSDAEANAKLNGINNVHFTTGDVRQILKDSSNSHFIQPDIIITDPPRAGMHKEVIASILQLEAKNMIYVSCNPSTQARDIKLLKEKYDLITVIPVDMFPHTSHIENVALLKLV